MSSHVKTKCVTISSTLIDEPYPLTEYVENNSSTRAAAYQRNRYVRECTYWIHEVTSSFGDYGKSRLTP